MCYFTFKNPKQNLYTLHNYLSITASQSTLENFQSSQDSNKDFSDVYVSQFKEICATFNTIQADDFETYLIHSDKENISEYYTETTVSTDTVQLEEDVDKIYYFEDLDSYTEYDVKNMLNILDVDDFIGLEKLCLEIKNRF